MTLRILFVDDEPRILDGLRRMLRPLRHEWDMQFENNGPQALQTLSQESFDAVVTDMRMPGMDGGALLKAVAEQHPEVLRLVLSGQSDLERLVTAAGYAHQYLAKPCTLEQLAAAVTRSLPLRDMLRDSALKRLVAKVDTVPSLPEQYFSLARALDSPNSSIGDIGQIISRDIGMTAKVLQLANSAFFGRSQCISNPADAVTCLGTTMIRGLALATHLFRGLEFSELGGLTPHSLWDHSLRCSSIASEVARTVRPADKHMGDAARVGGLLHDVGRLLLLSRSRDAYKSVLSVASGRHLTLHEAEREVLGVSHAEVGAYLLALWGLPSPIIDAVWHHHTPSNYWCNSFSAVSAVHVAEVISSGDGRAILDAPYLEKAGVGHLIEQWQSAHDAGAGVEPR